MSLQETLQTLLADVAAAATESDLEQVRLHYFGRKGVATAAMKNMDFSSMSPEERKLAGQQRNELKTQGEAALADRKAELATGGSVNVDFDITALPTDSRLGSMHPVNLVRLQLESVFRGMGFRICEGDEATSEFFNFDALNIPTDHPARDTHDTYWLKNGDVLRTHTSAAQVPTLLKHGAPLRAIFPGRCFRYESVDASHENTFYQMEGLVIDRGITVANLIGVMKLLLSEVFGRDVEVRLRPGYFPFVEPGFELDFRCALCAGQGCSTCKGTGWIELIPCGLVHPKVIENAGLDSSEFTGFAFGCGLTRLAMMRYHIPIIRHFNAGDTRFAQQFAPLA